MIKTKKYSYIDSVRGYAVILVLLTHVYAFGGGKHNTSIALSNFWVQCRMGVMLFYIISAMTLFLSYGQKHESEKRPVADFFIRRLMRIVPLFYLVCMYRLVFLKFDTWSIIGTITFTNGFMPKYINGIVVGGWSIAVETTFYILCPFLFKLITNINRAVWFIAITIVLSIALRVLAFKFLLGHFTNDDLLSWTLDWLPLQLPVFGMGIFLYFLFFKEGAVNDLELKFKKPLAYFLMLLSLYIFIIASYSSRLFIYENISFGFILTLFVIGMGVYPNNIFNNKPAQFLGKISYSFYLFHPIVIDIIGLPFLNKLGQTVNPTIGFALCYLLVMAVTTVAAYASYRLIEQPFQKLGVRWINKIEASPKKEAVAA